MENYLVKPMRRVITLIGSATCLLLLGLYGAGCDFLDPTRVENPRTTLEDFQKAPEPVAALLPGLRAQFARALGAVVVITEFVTDNFSINGTGLGGTVYDFPRDIKPVDMDRTSRFTGPYWNLQELRALADFLINEVAPNDERATPEQLAEAHYYRGMAYLMLGENFVAVPVEKDGSPVPAAQLLERAINDLEQALGTSAQLPDGVSLDLAARAALARAHRALGHAAPADQFAQQVLAADPEFLFAQGFDASSIDNAPWAYLVARALQEMQPLPRLDFLDPKYIDRESPIPVAKAEEMLLIRAEVALANGDETAARNFMKAARALAASRPVAEFQDDDPRLDNDLNPRPRSSSIVIADEPGAPFRAGLVKDRPGLVTVPLVSATSVTDADIDAASGTALIRLLYLMRQEILFLEARRMHDLGIRLPVMLREINTNPNLNDGDLGTRVFVPDYIPPANEMDLYDPLILYDEQGNLLTNQVTIRIDMNRVLAESRGLVVQNPLLPGQ